MFSDVAFKTPHKIAIVDDFMDLFWSLSSASKEKQPFGRSKS